MGCTGLKCDKQGKENITSTPVVPKLSPTVDAMAIRIIATIPLEGETHLDLEGLLWLSTMIVNLYRFLNCVNLFQSTRLYIKGIISVDQQFYAW